MALVKVCKKFRQILSRRQKIRIIEMFFLMVLAGIMEMLSVSLILPFIEIVMNPVIAMKKSYVQCICSWFGINSSLGFLVLMSLSMAVLYILKNAFLLFQMTVQNRFVYNNMFDTQLRLLRSYFCRPYEYFLDVKSGDILRMIGEDTRRAFNILTMILSLFSDLIVSGALLFTVLVISPEMTVSMGVLLLIMTCVIQAVTRPLLKRAGEDYQVTYSGMNQWLLQSIQGIKEIKLMRRERYFEKQFAENGRAYVRSSYLYQTLSVVPRYMIEAVAMSTFFVVIAFMISHGAVIEQLLPALSGLAMAAVRLLPSVNRISGSLAGITFGEPAVDTLLDNLQKAAAYKNIYNNKTGDHRNEIKHFKQKICFSEIYYKYPEGSTDILHNACMEIEKGMSAGLTGVSGAGKTTAADILLGLLKPQKGNIFVDGTDIQENMEGWLSNLGYIPQTIFMLDGTIRENVAFGLDHEEINDDLVWAALKDAAIDRFVRSLPEGLYTQIGERGVRLSGGQRQRLGIARALYSNPDVLVFDEATSALDHETETVIMDSIHRLHGSKTMIIIAHRLSTIEECDIVYRVENGKIKKER